MTTVEDAPATEISHVPGLVLEGHRRVLVRDYNGAVQLMRGTELQILRVETDPWRVQVRVDGAEYTVDGADVRDYTAVLCPPVAVGDYIITVQVPSIDEDNWKLARVVCIENMDSARNRIKVRMEGTAPGQNNGVVRGDLGEAEGVPVGGTRWHVNKWIAAVPPAASAPEIGVGSRVRITSCAADSRTHVGREGVVSSVYSPEYTRDNTSARFEVNINNGDYLCEAAEVELLTPVTEASPAAPVAWVPQRGQTVRITGCRHDTRMHQNAVGTLVRVRGDGSYLVDTTGRGHGNCASRTVENPNDAAASLGVTVNDRVIMRTMHAGYSRAAFRQYVGRVGRVQRIRADRSIEIAYPGFTYATAVATPDGVERVTTRQVSAGETLESGARVVVTQQLPEDRYSGTQHAGKIGVIIESDHDRYDVDLNDDGLFDCVTTREGVELLIETPAAASPTPYAPAAGDRVVVLAESPGYPGTVGLRGVVTYAYSRASGECDVRLDTTNQVVVARSVGRASEVAAAPVVPAASTPYQARQGERVRILQARPTYRHEVGNIGVITDVHTGRTGGRTEYYISMDSYAGPDANVIADLVALPVPDDTTRVFIHDVIDVATKAAGGQGWCEEFVNCLRTMGLDPKVRLSGEVHIKLRVGMDSAGDIGVQRSCGANGPSYLRQAMRVQTQDNMNLTVNMNHEQAYFESPTMEFMEVIAENVTAEAPRDWTATVPKGTVRRVAYDFGRRNYGGEWQTTSHGTAILEAMDTLGIFREEAADEQITLPTENGSVVIETFSTGRAENRYTLLGGDWYKTVHSGNTLSAAEMITAGPQELNVTNTTRRSYSIGDRLV